MLRCTWRQGEGGVSQGWARSTMTTGRGDRGLRLETLICSSYDPSDGQGQQYAHSHTHSYTRTYSSLNNESLIKLDIYYTFSQGQLVKWLWNFKCTAKIIHYNCQFIPVKLLFAIKSGWTHIKSRWWDKYWKTTSLVTDFTSCRTSVKCYPA